MRLVDALAGELHLLDGSLSGCIYCEEIGNINQFELTVLRDVQK